MKVNYKSDFELTIQLTAGGVDVAAPSWDWQLRFYTCDRQAVYTVAYIDGKAERCAVNTDGTITAYFDKHGLMPGALLCEFVNLVPDSHYTHDTQVQVDPVELGVELWRGASDGGMDAVTLELAGQVLAEVQALAADLQQKAESGYFDGEPGPQGPQGPPGPAGPGLLVVTVTGSDQEALTADHTAAEILAAHEAGRPVVAVYGGEVYQLASVGASLASFSLASADLDVLAQIDVDGDGGAVRIFEEVQGALTAGSGITIANNVISATGGGGGTGIESIEQTVTSDESGGINVVTITMSDGSTADFEIMNGKKGDKGDKGDTGPQGPKGDSGVDLGEVVLVNDLTTGGVESALTAEQGKVLNEESYFLPQWISNGNFTSTSGWGNSLYCTISVNDNVLKAIPSNASATINIRQTGKTAVAGHKYFVKFYVRSTKAIDVFAGFTTNDVQNTPTVALEADVWTCVTGYIITSSNATNNGFRISAGMKLVSGEEHYVEVKEVIVVDLTAIFGEGNEPNDNIALTLLGDTWKSTYKVTQKKLYDVMQEHKIDSLNLDIWFPLSSGNYTPVTAVAAVGYGFRHKDLEIHFIDPDGYSVKMKYKSSDIDYTSWNKLNNWDIVSDGEKAGLTGGSIDFRGLGYSLPADSNGKVAYGDWYLEAFFEVLDGTGSISLLAYQRINTSAGSLLRFNQGSLQCALENPPQFRIGTSNFMQKAHHLFVRKNGDVYTTYVDGVQVSQVTMALTKTYGEFNLFENLSRLKLYMFRIGVPSADNDTQMLEHWNNGDVLGYKSNENDLVIEITRFAKHYVYDNVVGCAIPVSDGVVLESPAYPSEIVGAGAPATPPQYVGQRYYDTTNKRYYRAIGFTNVTDWKAFAYKDEVDAKQNALISGVTIKTINGTSILGAGNIDAGGGEGGGGSTNVVNVTDYGATGTGVTDDTSAIMQALEVARVSRLPLYFPANGGNCTYLTRKGLVLTTGMKVTADKGAILKNASAVLNDVNGNAGTGVCAVTTLTANAAQGAHSVVVASTAGLAVGQEVTIINSNLPSYQETLADITAISGKTITIDTSRFTASGDDEGVLYALTSGAYLTTDFSLIKTCIGKPAVDIEIENISLQACGNPDEPYIYTISPINQTRQAGTPDNAQKRIYIRDVTIDGSAQDGISTQGQSDVWIEDCIIKDIKYKGIHYGTSCDRVIIRGNYIYNCGVNVSSDGSLNGGAGAIYFCVNNHRVFIEGNHIENCRRGVFGFDFRGNGETDTDSIVRGNTFTNCHVYGVALKGGYRMIVEGNIFRSFTGASIPIFVESEGGGLLASVISNNVIGGFASGYTNTAGAIAINGAKQLVVSGNVVQSLSGATGSFDVIVKTSQKVALIGNVVAGSVDISDSGNSGCIAQNNIES